MNTVEPQRIFLQAILLYTLVIHTYQLHTQEECNFILAQEYIDRCGTPYLTHSFKLATAHMLFRRIYNNTAFIPPPEYSYSPKSRNELIRNCLDYAYADTILTDQHIDADKRKIFLLKMIASCLPMHTNTNWMLNLTLDGHWHAAIHLFDTITPEHMEKFSKRWHPTRNNMIANSSDPSDSLALCMPKQSPASEFQLDAVQLILTQQYLTYQGGDSIRPPTHLAFKEYKKSFYTLSFGRTPVQDLMAVTAALYAHFPSTQNILGLPEYYFITPEENLVKITPRFFITRQGPEHFSKNPAKHSLPPLLSGTRLPPKFAPENAEGWELMHSGQPILDPDWLTKSIWSITTQLYSKERTRIPSHLAKALEDMCIACTKFLHTEKKTNAPYNNLVFCLETAIQDPSYTAGSRTNFMADMLYTISHICLITSYFQEFEILFKYISTHKNTTSVALSVNIIHSHGYGDSKAGAISAMEEHHYAIPTLWYQTLEFLQVVFDTRQIFHIITMLYDSKHWLLAKVHRPFKSLTQRDLIEKLAAAHHLRTQWEATPDSGVLTPYEPPHTTSLRRPYPTESLV